MYYIYKNNMENLILRSGLGESDNSSSDIDQKIHITSLLTIFMEKFCKNSRFICKILWKKNCFSKRYIYGFKKTIICIFR